MMDLLKHRDATLKGKGTLDVSSTSSIPNRQKDSTFTDVAHELHNQHTGTYFGDQILRNETFVEGGHAGEFLPCCYVRQPHQPHPLIHTTNPAKKAVRLEVPDFHVKMNSEVFLN